MFQSRVSGVPCQIAVTNSVVVPPDPSSWDSDFDYYGYREIEFEVFDLKGYRAKWLENKLTKADNERIEQEAVDNADEQVG